MKGVNDLQYTKNIETKDTFDVVVAGGGTAGITAALSAAQLGARVLILERSGMIGGNLTLGHIGPTMGQYQTNTAADRINKLLRGDKYLVQDFELAKIRLMQLIEQHNITLYLNTAVADVITDNGRITEIIITTQNGLQAVGGTVFIDATGDAVLSYLAGEQIEIGRDDGLTQPSSIMFTIEGVDPDQTLICQHENMDTPLKKGNYLALCKKACESGELPPSVNIVRLYATTVSGERLVNATQANRLNALDLCDYTAAQMELRNQMLQVVKFLKNNVEGFENIRLKDSSDGIGVRETRRVMGQYLLTAEDLLACKRFPDVVVHRASFAIDIHNPDGAGQAESDSIPIQVQDYDIPYRALVPMKTQNLYLAGRCISGTHRAHASYRVMNIAMNIGEAAGVGAALCAKKGCTPTELDVKEVQRVLIARGIDLFE